MILSYQYRVQPTERQHRALERILESQRQLYNAALQERRDAYRLRGITLGYVDQCRGLTELRQICPEHSAVPVTLQRGTLKRLDRAYRAFFRRVSRGEKPGFPRFRGRGHFASFSFSEFRGLRFARDRLEFCGMPGRLRIHLHRPIPEGSRIKCCTFHREGKGWFVAFAVEIPPGQPRKTKRAVGIDLGIETFAALSDGGFIPNLRAGRHAEAKIAEAQRALCRKRPGSRARKTACAALARRHAAVVRQRQNYLHQASARLVRDYDVVAVESLNVLALSSGFLCKAVRDASWAHFLDLLMYKAERAGVRVIEVCARHTSQQCSGCGVLVNKELNVRRHECPNCHLSLDRDLNAARNILNRAGMGPGLRRERATSCAGKNLGTS